VPVWFNDESMTTFFVSTQLEVTAAAVYCSVWTQRSLNVSVLGHRYGLHYKARTTHKKKTKRAVGVGMGEFYYLFLKYQFYFPTISFIYCFKANKILPICC